MATLINGREIAPCICAKAKFALGISNIKPTNTKRCSPQYWIEVVAYFGKQHGKSKREIEQAIGRTDLFR